MSEQNEFEFEELLADMLDISDADRDADDSIIETKLFEKFGIDFDNAFAFTSELLNHTPTVIAGLSGTKYRAFVAKDKSLMLMKRKVKEQEQ